MAEKLNKTPSETVQVFLPLLEDSKASQEEFFSVGFKNYIIKRGEYVDVPKELAEVIKNGQQAKIASFRYAEEKKLNDSQPTL